jgi:hypothetical protein
MGVWRVPEVRIQRLQATLHDGQLEASAHLNVPNRELQSQFKFDFDVHQIKSMLTRPAQRWLGQFTWTTPPHVTAEARLILPAWTDKTKMA